MKEFSQADFEAIIDNCPMIFNPHIFEVFTYGLPRTHKVFVFFIIAKNMGYADWEDIRDSFTPAEWEISLMFRDKLNPLRTLGNQTDVRIFAVVETLAMDGFQINFSTLKAILNHPMVCIPF